MKHRLQIWPHFVNSGVERQLRRGPVGTDAGAVRLDADDVSAVQSALIDTGRSDPDIAVVIHNGQVAAGSGGHTLVVNALHEHNQLIRRMNKVDIHKKPPLHLLAHTVFRTEHVYIIAENRLINNKYFGLSKQAVPSDCSSLKESAHKSKPPLHFI